MPADDLGALKHTKNKLLSDRAAEDSRRRRDHTETITTSKDKLGEKPTKIG